MFDKPYSKSSILLSQFIFIPPLVPSLLCCLHSIPGPILRIPEQIRAEQSYQKYKSDQAVSVAL